MGLFINSEQLPRVLHYIGLADMLICVLWV